MMRRTTSEGSEAYQAATSPVLARPFSVHDQLPGVAVVRECSCRTKRDRREKMGLESETKG